VSPALEVDVRHLALLRTFLARHPLAYWVAVAALAAVVAGSLAAEHGRLRAERRAWGEVRTVWVATGDLRPGDPLAARAVDLPAAMVPSAALAAPGAGDHVVQHVADGEVLTAADAGAGLLATLPDDHLAIAVGVDDVAPPLSPGDVVVVLAEGIVLAERAVVVHRGELAVTVGMPGADAPAVAMAAQQRVATLALRAP